MFEIGYFKWPFGLHSALKCKERHKFKCIRIEIWRIPTNKSLLTKVPRYWPQYNHHLHHKTTCQTTILSLERMDGCLFVRVNGDVVSHFGWKKKTILTLGSNWGSRFSRSETLICLSVHRRQLDLGSWSQRVRQRRQDLLSGLSVLQTFWWSECGR